MKKPIKKFENKKVKNTKTIKGGILRRAHMQSTVTAVSYEDIIEEQID